MAPTSAFEDFEFEITSLRKRLYAHPLYSCLNDIQALRHFMSVHIFAVWDFMSLLKTLQARLTEVQTPWMGGRDPVAARFINEIVLAEETDEISPGKFLSHFDLYRAAMVELNANTEPFDNFLQKLRNDQPKDAREVANWMELHLRQGPAFPFMMSTFTQCTQATHEVAAAFLFGREDIIPQMFQRVLNSIATEKAELKAFKKYLERHIEIDGEAHGPMGRKLLLHLCGDSPRLWLEAREAAKKSIGARISLWDSIVSSMPKPAGDKLRPLPL